MSAGGYRGGYFARFFMAYFASSGGVVPDPSAATLTVQNAMSGSLAFRADLALSGSLASRADLALSGTLTRKV